MRNKTKGLILAAAARVAVMEGVQNLTFDAVAAEAGVSKGGVLYHFSNKEALLVAMVTALVGITEDRIMAYQKDDREPGSWVRGFVRACLTEEDEALGSVGRLSVAFLTAAASNKELLSPMVDRQPSWRASLNDSGIDPTMAHIIRLAADGIWINDVMGLPVLSDKERVQVLERLIEMTKHKT